MWGEIDNLHSRTAASNYYWLIEWAAVRRIDCTYTSKSSSGIRWGGGREVARWRRRTKAEQNEAITPTFAFAICSGKSDKRASSGGKVASCHSAKASSVPKESRDGFGPKRTVTVQSQYLHNIVWRVCVVLWKQGRQGLDLTSSNYCVLFCER